MEHRAGDINESRPTSVSHVIGQRFVVEQVKVALDAAQQDGRKFDHALLVGPPGIGKTATAKIIADEMATDFREIQGQSVTETGDLNAWLLSATDRQVLFIDEAHELGGKLQTALYLALDQRRILLRGGKGGGGIPASLSIADFTLLLATTDEHRLLQPLRDRMRLVLRFHFYTVEELEKIVALRMRASGWNGERGLEHLVAERGRGTPRLALRLLQAAYRVSRAEGEKSISLKHLQRACELEELDNLGLGPLERKYLNIVAKAPTRINVIASILGLPARTISEVMEPFLVRSDLIEKDDQARRRLTALGQKHLLLARPIAV